MTDFTRLVLNWYACSGRHDLPWQQDLSPYRVWVSEIMLQQTQVNTVIPYFRRFIERFSDLSGLASANIDEVLHLWSGLGYYSRARNLHKAARIITEELNGEVPDKIDQLINLPGIGRSTAGAILALSMNQAHPILDGNVKRVLCRYYAVKEWPGERQTEKRLWQLAEKHTSINQSADYTQAIMDLGATICTRTNPDCETCPLYSGCLARQMGLQNDMPGKKPKKVIPLRQTRFIMLENATGEVLLQKRPPTGIWGGLWGFPECPVDADISEWMINKFGYTVDSIRYEQGLRHTFTHFRLDIIPVRMKLITRQGQIQDEENLYWFKPVGDNRSIGMATPVRKLVTRHYASAEEV